jgi:MFS family permease
MENRPRRILPVIIASQFAGTSLWFASNAVLPDLQRHLNITASADAVGLMTSSVQLGFILGTLAFAFFTFADRYSPRMLFFICSILGALFNLFLFLFTDNFTSLIVFRFLTGICLAGIYPVGMKIASGWYREGLGNALGLLVGALVVGTAFPHFLKGLGQSLDWRTVILAISALSTAGGLLMLLLVPNGPYLSKAAPFNPSALKIIFSSREVRAATFGYFGHMWELYTFYTFVPILVTAYAFQNLHENLNVSFWSFAIIAAGGIGCAGGGLISRKAGSASVAWVQLLASGICCLLSPFLFHAPLGIFLSFVLFWGIVVVGDSPQFSALVARYAPQEFVGSALTIMNSIGFAITIVSIQTVSALSTSLGEEYLFLPLAIGPVIGLLSLRPLLNSHRLKVGTG